MSTFARTQGLVKGSLSEDYENGNEGQKVPKRYREEDIERGLIAAASLGIRPAGRETGIPESTLRGWIDDYPERYAELREQEAPKWRARAAAAFEDIVEGLTDIEWDLLKRVKETASKMEGKDAANALKSASIAKGINTDKAYVLRGLPTHIEEHRVDMPAIDAAIRMLLERGAVDAEAVEVAATELPEETP